MCQSVAGLARRRARKEHFATQLILAVRDGTIVVPIPKDILHRIATEFRAEEIRDVVQTLEAYQGPERDRIARCILFLSRGSLRQLKENAERARSDYRDVIYFAEYDEEDRHVHDFSRAFDD